MAAPEEGEGERPAWMSAFQDMEEGVRFFFIFLITLVAGFLLALRGFVMLPVILGACAVISLLAVLLRPSREALARRAGKEASEEGTEEEEEEEKVDEDAGSDHLLEDAPAPTSTRKEAPAPPPEPPPMEEVVVDLEEDDEGSATDDEVWA